MLLLRTHSRAPRPDRLCYSWRGCTTRCGHSPRSCSFAGSRPRIASSKNRKPAAGVGLVKTLAMHACNICLLHMDVPLPLHLCLQQTFGSDSLLLLSVRDMGPAVYTSRWQLEVAFPLLCSLIDGANKKEVMPEAMLGRRKERRKTKP